MMSTGATGGQVRPDGGSDVPGSTAPPARPGEDGTGFSEHFAPLRGEVHAHCYRMLGSLHDADDATQEVMLRAWRSIGTFAGRSSPRTWLMRIATNVCLDFAARTTARAVPMDLGPASSHAVPDGRPRADIDWIQPYPDRALAGLQGSPHARYELLESVELAFITALQHLPVNQRAALLLFDVLGLSAREIADLMATSPASVNSALQRARALLATLNPDPSQQPALRAFGDPALSELVSAYVAATERGDARALIALLTEDATWSMPPLASWYRGHTSIRDFLERMALVRPWTHLRTHANGQPAVAGYLWQPDERIYTAYGIDVFTISDGLICAVTTFIDDSLFAPFNLPPVIPAGRQSPL